ncbi:hypothetical protein [Streptomyces sp. SID13031]|uniref:hypothetical protein n=1 Tax=Streptomyces sp. SID13031 TaxID=2706046 RepID=UPI0013C9C4FC|nr:hypothetical protein [Streptomyces sp. SID13031]NEA34820.1 hypothetical protein [Streptomyces sp. SID13031]
MRKALIAAVLLAASAGLSPAAAEAAPPPITTASLKTTQPATTCVRGAARPLINGTTPVLHAFVPAPAGGNPISVSVDFRITDLADNSVVFSAQSYTKVQGVWYEPQINPTLLDGKTYSWQARVFDGTEYSAWSATCEFSIDTVKPNSPVVTITPAGGVYKVGQRITLHFGANGSTDVAKYSYHLMGKPPVDVKPCPGTATIKLTTVGPDSITAASYDKAGNESFDDTIVDFTVLS